MIAPVVDLHLNGVNATGRSVEKASVGFNNKGNKQIHPKGVALQRTCCQFCSCVDVEDNKQAIEMTAGAHLCWGKCLVDGMGAGGFNVFLRLLVQNVFF